MDRRGAPAARGEIRLRLRCVALAALLAGCAGTPTRPPAEAEAVQELRSQLQAQSALVAQQQRSIADGTWQEWVRQHTVVRHAEAEAGLLALVAAYPQHSAADNALYLAGLVREVRGDFASALELFESVPRRYPAGDAVPQAQLER